MMQTLSSNPVVLYLHCLKLFAMSTALWVLLFLILAEIGYLVAYSITLIMVRTVFFGVEILLRRTFLLSLQTWIIGTLGGCSGCIVALFILFSIRNHAEITGYWYLIISIVVIFYGQIMYLVQSFEAASGKETPALGWPGKLNAAASAILQRVQFELVKKALYKKKPDQVGVEGDPLGHQAYLWVKDYMYRVSLAALLGILICLALYFWLYYR